MTMPTATSPSMFSGQRPQVSVATDPNDPQAMAADEFLREQELRALKLYKHSEEGKKTLDWVMKEYSRLKSPLETIKQQWYINLAMLYGNQYVDRLFTRNGSFDRVGTQKVAKHRVRAVTNYIRPMIRTELARMTSQKPTVSVIPASSEDSDMMAAIAAEALWEYLYSQKNMQSIMRRNAFWTSVIGTGIIKTTWDDSYVDPMQGFRGDVKFEVVTPFNFMVPELLTEDVEDQPWVFHVTTRPLQWVKTFFKDQFDDPKNVAPNCVQANEILDESRFLLPGSTNSVKPDSVLIIEAYIKPGYTECCPDGAMVTVAGNEIVGYKTGLPYPHGQYPFAKSVHIPTGKFYGDSVLIDIIPLQREYNRTTSQLIESKNRMARPQLLVAEGSIDATRYTSEPGLIIPYKMGFPRPETMTMSDIPSYVIQQQQETRQAMEDISGQHQVTRGQAPGGGVQAATAIAFLQEKDDSLMATTFSSLEEMLEKMGRQALALSVEYMATPRIIRIVGMDGAFDTIELKGSELATDLKVEGGSALPESKPAKQAFLMDMAKEGFISPDQLLDLLDFGGVDALNKQLNLDRRQAQRENIRMRGITAAQYQQYITEQSRIAEVGGEGAIDPNTGTQITDPGNPETFSPIVPVNDWDNHKVHIMIHNNYRKSQEFEVQPEWVKYEFDKHVKYHMMQYEMQQMGMAPTPPADGQQQDPTLAPVQEAAGMAPQQPMMPPPGQDQGLPPSAQPPVNPEDSGSPAMSGGR